jgi:hypothetical protein
VLHVQSVATQTDGRHEHSACQADGTSVAACPGLGLATTAAGGADVVAIAGALVLWQSARVGDGSGVTDLGCKHWQYWRRGGGSTVLAALPPAASGSSSVENLTLYTHD